MKTKYIPLLIVVLSVLAFCPNHLYQLSYPECFPTPKYDFTKNPLSTEKIALGRKLFYDPILSKDNSISCASCHSPFNSFAHTDHDLSHGINDQIGTRNAPALFNLAWQELFMWDGAVNHLDMQALAPISHQKEMGESIQNVVSKILRNNTYPTEFFTAFGDSNITGELLLKAISQFELTLISSDSKYDHVKKGRDSFTEQEKSGYLLFQKNCNACHTEPLFSNYSFANNGLPIDTSLKDFGRWKATNSSSDSLRFKIPSLRNLSYTYPYMHDGRFKKLGEVLNHYTNGVVQYATLSTQLKTPIELTANEKVDLISFLMTLNDKEFVFNPNHQFPKEILSNIKNQ
jgi:cytochrome c peroxidase